MKATLLKKVSEKHYEFQDIECEKPHPQEHDVLLSVKAISVNPVDYKVRRNIEANNGREKILGWDASGIVIETGSKVTSLKKGDEVYYAGDLQRSGSNCEFQLVDERLVGKKPRSLDFAQAAALPLTTLAAWEIISDRLKLNKDSTPRILITSAAGGVGSVLIQLLKVKTKATVIATYGREESKTWLEQMGADICISHHKSLSEQLVTHKINSVDVVISLNYTDDYLSQFFACLKPQGALLFIDEPKKLNVLDFKSKSISIYMEFMFTRSMFQTEDMAEQQHILNQMAALIDQGAVKTTLDKVFGPLNAKTLEQAHTLIERGQIRGKIVLTLS